MRNPIISQNDGKPSSAQKDSNFGLFLENAFFLIANRKHIMSNPKMYNTVIDANNGLAYSGNSGLKNTSLGCYLNWWTNCLQASDIDNENNKWLIARVAGSPLSGCNNCLAVSNDGKVKFIEHPHFKILWKTLMENNKMFNDTSLQQEAYTLQEVIDLLRQNSSYDEKDTHIFFLERAYYRQKSEIEALNETRKRYYDKISQLKVEAKNTLLQPHMEEYTQLREMISYYTKKINTLKINLKIKLKAGQIDRHRYQRLHMYLCHRRDMLQERLKLFRSRIMSCVDGLEGVTFSEILTYYQPPK